MATKKQPSRPAFPSQIPKAQKKGAGRTAAAQTISNIRTSGVRVDDATREHVNTRLGRQLGKFALHIERTTVRFADENGPRGGIDKSCHIKVVLSGLPSVIFEAKAATVAEAFDRAAQGAERAVRRSIERSGLKTPRSKANRKASSAGAPRARANVSKRHDDDGSLIGRRVGRSKANLERAAKRPEKLRRDAAVDTAAPGRSASDRKVGAGATARRNTKLNRAGMIATLEDSAQNRPSRKSTRKGANRAKQDNALTRNELRALQTPTARARRSRTGRPL